MVDFIAWVAGNNPDLQTIFASYSDALGERANSELQRIFDSAAYQRLFWGTQIPAVANISAELRYKRNSSLLEFIDHRGSFRNTTVNGQITGFSLDLGVIDDPMKGRVSHRPGVTADAPKLRLTTLLHIGRARVSRSAACHRPGVARDQVSGVVVRHFYFPRLCVDATVKARRWAHSALAGRSVPPCDRVRPLADTPCRRAFPFAGGAGLPGRSCARFSMQRRGSADGMGPAYPCADP